MQGQSGLSPAGSLKPATLEIGMEVRVPLFIKEGELVKVAVVDGKYVERVREGKR